MKTHMRPMLVWLSVAESIDPALSAWLGGVSITPCPTGGSQISGRVEDPAALYGLIAQLRDLGLTLTTLNTAPERAFLKG